MGLHLAVPDFATLSRCSNDLNIRQNPNRFNAALTPMVDSAGLTTHGVDGWDTKKLGARKPRKKWRKLHLAFNRDTGDIVDSDLTTQRVADETAPPLSVAETHAEGGRFLADGAYDGEGVSDCLAAKFGHEVEIILPPPKNTILGENLQGSQHIGNTAAHGRMKWQKQAGHNQGSFGEAQIGRWKDITGGALQDRKIDNQITETRVAARDLNRICALGRAYSVARIVGVMSQLPISLDRSVSCGATLNQGQLEGFAVFPDRRPMCVGCLGKRGQDAQSHGRIGRSRPVPSTAPENPCARLCNRHY
jgi:hypothetical protein